MRLFVLAMVLLGLLMVSLLRAPVQGEMARVKAELGALKAEVDAMHEKNRALAREARLLRDDLAAIERVARQTYGLMRADELVIGGESATRRDPAPRSAAPTEPGPRLETASLSHTTPRSR